MVDANIEILNFFPDQNKNKQGYVDFKIYYSEDKWEIFRNIVFFEKNDGSRWLTLSHIKRNEEWIPPYERSPSLHKIFDKALNALDDFLKKPEI